MNYKPQLVLDAGGVLVTNLSPMFWQQIAENGSVELEELVGHYKKSMSALLWSGRTTEDGFWQWLKQSYPSIATQHAQERLAANLTLLPAVHRLEQWSSRMDIHLLSNHRTEWLLPVLKPFLGAFTTITISSEVGYAKPHEAIYAHAAERLPAGAEVLFVDDQEKNLLQAAAAGWQCMLADAEGKWVEEIEARYIL